MRDVQTTTVPPGGAMVADLKLEVPGKFMLVDHALSRVERGLALGFLHVESGPLVRSSYHAERHRPDPPLLTIGQGFGGTAAGADGGM